MTQFVLIRYNFFIDFFTSIPVDFIVLQTNGQSSQWTQGVTILKVFRFFKLFRVWRVGQFLGRVFRRFDINPAVILGMKMFAGFFVVTHGLTCFLFYIGTLTDLFKACDDDHECNNGTETESCDMIRWNQLICPCRDDNSTSSWCVSKTWLTETYFMMPGNRSMRAIDASIANQYWITLYWVVTTMATIGFGDIKPQTQYEIWTCILCQIIGAAAFGFIVGNMTNIAQLLNGRKERLTGEIDELNVLLRHFKAPRDLQRHATKLVRHQFHKPIKLIKRDLIDRVPIWIAVDIAKEAFRSILHRSSLFAHLASHTLDRLYLRLQPLTFVPGEYLFRAGDRATAIMFILNGTVHIIDTLQLKNRSIPPALKQRSASTLENSDGNDCVVSSVLAGGYLGENSLAYELELFQFSARASNTCDVLYLLSSDISRSFSDQSEDLVKLRLKCQMRYRRFMCLIMLTRKLQEVKSRQVGAVQDKKLGDGRRRSSFSKRPAVLDSCDVERASLGKPKRNLKEAQDEAYAEGSSQVANGLNAQDARCGNLSLDIGPGNRDSQGDHNSEVLERNTNVVNRLHSGHNSCTKAVARDSSAFQSDKKASDLLELSNLSNVEFLVSGQRFSVDSLDAQTRDCLLTYSKLRQGELEISLESFLGNSSINADTEKLLENKTEDDIEVSNKVVNQFLHGLLGENEGNRDISTIERKLKAIWKRIRAIEKIPGFAYDDPDKVFSM